jgi:hypothetical protein
MKCLMTDHTLVRESSICETMDLSHKKSALKKKAPYNKLDEANRIYWLGKEAMTQGTS